MLSMKSLETDGIYYGSRNALQNYKIFWGNSVLGILRIFDVGVLCSSKATSRYQFSVTLSKIASRFWTISSNGFEPFSIRIASLAG